MNANEVSTALRRSMVGQRVDDVAKGWSERGWVVRVVNADGKPMLGTQNFMQNRINVSAVDGLIVDVVGIG